MTQSTRDAIHMSDKGPLIRIHMNAHIDSTV